MTAIRRRRRRATVLAYVASGVAIAAAAILGLAGTRTLFDSTTGQNAAGDDQTVFAQRLPYTPTALLGVVDDEGRLTSLIVAAVESDGTGGSIVQVPVASDPSSGNADELSPIDAVLEVAGPIAFRESVERLTGLSFDAIEIVDPERFAQLITPLGDMTVTLPGEVVDTSSDELWEAGQQSLTAPGAARLITATDPSLESWTYEPVRSAVWAAVADRVGAGINSASPVADDTDLPPPASTDEFLARLFAGPVEFRALQFRPVEADQVAEELGGPYRSAFGPDAPDAVVLLDRAEMLMVFGGIAPGRLGAPLDAPSFRVVSAFTEADTDPLAPADVILRVVNVLMFTKVNVVSVADLSGEPGVEVPEITRMIVADPAIDADQLVELYEPQFGTIEVVPATVGIDGIDAEIVLGRSYLERLARDAAPDVAGSSGDDDTDETDG